MIAALVALSGLAVLALPGLLPLRPTTGQDRARALVGSTLVGLVAFEIGLVLLALPTALDGLVALGLATVEDCPLLPPALGGPLVGAFAGLVAIVIAARCVYVIRRAHQQTRSMRAEPWLGSHAGHDGFDLVVLPTDSVLALSVPGRPPQVLVSQGLLDRLEPDEVAAVLRHEAAHVRGRHWRFTLTALLAEQVLSPSPIARPSARALRDALELWADETAVVDASGERDSLHGALLSVACDPTTSHYFDDGPSKLRSAIERVRRLEQPVARRSLTWRVLSHSPAVIVGLAVLAMSTTSIIGTEHAVVLTR